MSKLQNKVQLIVYPNRIGSNLHDLFGFIDQNLSEAIHGVHILPIYPSNADSGFSPLTHQKVDPKYGDWRMIHNFAKKYDICLDLMLNHLSNESPEFQDYLKHGEKSKYATLFIDVDRDFPDMTEEAASKIQIRKEKQPFIPFKFQDGTTRRIWSTFTNKQIDLNYKSRITYKVMEENMEFLAQKGIKLLRLDAFGYITKKTGTNCFLLEPEVFEKLDWFNQVAQKNEMYILPEVHDHPSYQTAIASRDMYSYGFALPPLALYTILYKDSTYLKNWLRTCPHNQITVLDTHDGITIPDVEDLIPEPKIMKLIDDLTGVSADPIMRRTAGKQGMVGAIYQITTSIYSAFGEDDDKYIAARAIQMFTPGIPQIYYQGLLAGENDYKQLDKHKDDPREINRSIYTLNQAQKHLTKPVVKRLLKLLEFRNSYPAFDGEFVLYSSNSDCIKLGWKDGICRCFLDIDLNTMKSQITYIKGQNTKTIEL